MTREELLKRYAAGERDFKEANLKNTNLSKVNLKDANLEGANLRNTNLSGTDLSNANLMGANLMGANLMGANLMGANLTDTILMEADLTNANLSGATLNRITNLMSGEELLKRYAAGERDFSGADLRGVSLNGANLISNSASCYGIGWYYNPVFLRNWPWYFDDFSLVPGTLDLHGADFQQMLDKTTDGILCNQVLLLQEVVNFVND